MLRQILIDRREAERALTIVNEAGPDPDRATHLAMIRGGDRAARDVRRSAATVKPDAHR
jgi:hypothetical protein